MELKIVARREGRLSSFLTGELKMSSSLMNKLKWGDAIQVNGVPQRTNYPVRPGDLVAVRLDEEEPEYPAEEGHLTILYEDDYLLAVDKPAGMLIHPSRSCFSGTLANLVAGYYARIGQKSAFHPMTRLDRDTFGIVLLAKNAHVHTLLQSTPVQKTYHALTFGGPEADQGIIDAPIARKELPSLLREIREDGKPSVTRYRVLERNGKLCKLALEPVTGRTHQLRLHCMHSGFPILGDPQYHSEESASFSRTLGLPYQLLCAKKLELAHPITGENLVLQSHMDAEIPTR
ncbi:MAG: RluA family pseudouridine synthase [Oscillospiraceae bacterium]|nr:RluA family pseudouridine synthase [Oscillospiraceae bacterium]